MLQSYDLDKFLISDKYPVYKPFTDSQKVNILENKIVSTLFTMFRNDRDIHLKQLDNYVLADLIDLYRKEVFYKNDDKLKLFLIYIFIFTYSEIHEYIDSFGEDTILIKDFHDSELFDTIKEKITYYNKKEDLVNIHPKSIINNDGYVVIFTSEFKEILGPNFINEIVTILKEYDDCLYSASKKYELIRQSYGSRNDKYSLMRRFLRNILERDKFEFEDFLLMFDVKYDHYTGYINPSFDKVSRCEHVAVLLLNEMIFKKKIFYVER